MHTSEVQPPFEISGGPNRYGGAQFNRCVQYELPTTTHPKASSVFVACPSPLSSHLSLGQHQLTQESKPNGVQSQQRVKASPSSLCVFHKVLFRCGIAKAVSDAVDMDMDDAPMEVGSFDLVQRIHSRPFSSPLTQHNQLQEFDFTAATSPIKEESVAFTRDKPQTHVSRFKVTRPALSVCCCAQ